MYDADTIVHRYLSGERQSAIARSLGAHPQTISRIVRSKIGKTDKTSHMRRVHEGRRTMFVERQNARINSGEFRIELTDSSLVVTCKGQTYLFDTQDEELLRKYCWRVYRTGRLGRQFCEPDGRRKNIYVYHDILGVVPSRAQVVDHINCSVFDNRRANLRICSYSENAYNRTKKVGVPHA